MTKEVKLLVNDTAVPLDYFVEGFIDHTVGGMMAALEATGELKTLELSINGDDVSINLNGAAVPANRFVSKIIKSTVNGMVSTLKGVSGVNRVNIKIKR